MKTIQSFFIKNNNTLTIDISDISLISVTFHEREMGWMEVATQSDIGANRVKDLYRNG